MSFQSSSTHGSSPSHGRSTSVKTSQSLFSGSNDDTSRDSPRNLKEYIAELPQLFLAYSEEERRHNAEQAIHIADLERENSDMTASLKASLKEAASLQERLDIAEKERDTTLGLWTSIHEMHQETQDELQATQDQLQQSSRKLARLQHLSKRVHTTVIRRVIALSTASQQWNSKAPQEDLLELVADQTSLLVHDWRLLEDNYLQMMGNGGWELNQ